MSRFGKELFEGKTALITGASSGIGRAFAERAAACGARLIVVARREDALQELAAELHGRYSSAVHVMVADLAVPGAASALTAAIGEAGWVVDVLVNNAGVGSHADLVAAAPERMVSQIQLNVSTLAELTTRLLPGMVARGSGAIINIASTAAFQPIPHMAVYGATKAFVLSFTRALWAETRSTGVRVVAVCPGATETEFFEIAGEDASVGRRRTPGDVVDTALRALARKRPSVVDGRVNALVAAVCPRMPERLVLRVAERTVRPRVDAH